MGIGAVGTTSYLNQGNGQGTIFVDGAVSQSFAENTVQRYQNLLGNSKNVKAKNLVILKNGESAKNIEGISKETAEYLAGEGSIAYGLYDKKSDSIFILEDSHNRKEEKYEGSHSEQGADTVTHEYGHLLDEGCSQSNVFKNAYLKDLKNISKMLDENPNQTIAG